MNILKPKPPEQAEENTLLILESPTRKGGVFTKPTTPRPDPPKGSNVNSKKEMQK